MPHDEIETFRKELLGSKHNGSCAISRCIVKDGSKVKIVNRLKAMYVWRI